MHRFAKYKVYHIVFWILYYIFWTRFSMQTYGTHIFMAVLSTTVYFIAQAGVGYFSIYYLLPKYFFSKRYLVFTSLVALCVLVGGLLIAESMIYLFPGIGKVFSFGAYFLYSLMAVFSSTLLFIAVKLIKERVNAQKMHSTLEKEKTENELKFLKAQTNPHFLFNAINSIYVLIKKDPDLAEATLARFSDMLRYQLYECNFDEVPIGKEVEYLNNYIELEKLRKGKTLTIRYANYIATENFLISPLLIIPFIENAFKHVSTFADKENFIDITLDYKNGVFQMDVKNSIDKLHVKQNDPLAGGIGQENTKRRLKLIYPGTHQLTIEETQDVYFISLTIQIP